MRDLVFRLAEYADTCGKAVCAEKSGIPTTTTNLSQGVASFVQLGITLVGALAVIFVAYGGLQMVLSAGNPQRVKQARETILYAVVGIVVAVAAYAIVTFITTRIT